MVNLLNYAQNDKSLWMCRHVNQGRNSVANLRKMTIYNTNVDLVNDNADTKFGLILSIHYQDIEKKPWILASIRGRNSVANLRKMTIYTPNVYLVNDHVYTKFS